ncbi:MAG: hypothetical protein ABFC38_00475 [Methanospirillum sp.]
MVGNDAEVGIEILNFAGTGRPVLLGITERLEFVDAPGHVEDLARYRAPGNRMAGNRIANGKVYINETRDSGHSPRNTS